MTSFYDAVSVTALTVSSFSWCIFLKMSYRLFRHAPTSVKRDLRQRFHPYLTPPLSISDMTNPSEFHDRMEAFDSFNHSALTYGGLMRQYDVKRQAICQLSREMATLEKKMIDLHKKMREEADTLVSFTPVESDSDSKEEINLHDILDDDESDIEATPHATPLSVSSSSTLTTSLHPFRLTETMEDEQHRTITVKYRPRISYRLGTRNYSRGIRCRVYEKEVVCDLCTETYSEHYKCSNGRCKYKICYECFVHLDVSPELCPFCRYTYELPAPNALSEIPMSPIALPPPRAVSPEY